MKQFLPPFIFAAFALHPAVGIATDGAETNVDADVISDNSMAKADAAESTLVLVEQMASVRGPAKIAADSASPSNEQEEIWVEISDAIESLNDVVGDKMFLDLRRRNESEMEVRVDVGFWQRVRYETRVDLKNDISNIWHLYAQQYYDVGFSSVHFVDDKTDKTIDIFTNAR